MVTDRHLYICLLGQGIMRRKGYKLTHTEKEVVTGIHSDQRFVKYPGKPILIEYESSGQEKKLHHIVGHAMITVNLKNYKKDLNEPLNEIIQRLDDEISQQLETITFELNRDKNAYKQELMNKKKEYDRKQRKQATAYLKRVKKEIAERKIEAEYSS